jgi:hypothetical protein
MKWCVLLLLLTGCANWNGTRDYTPARPPPPTNEFQAFPPTPKTSAAMQKQLSAVAISLPRTNNTQPTNWFITIPYPPGSTTNALIRINRGPTSKGPWTLLNYFSGIPGTNCYDVPWTNTGEFFSIIVIHP